MKSPSTRKSDTYNRKKDTQDMKLYIVTWKFPLHDKYVITICTNETDAHDLGQSYCDHMAADWLQEWEDKHNSDPVYQPFKTGYPSFEITECETDTRGEVFPHLLVLNPS